MIRRTLPLLTDPVLDDVITRLVECVRPTRIVLFGSRARGDAGSHSDYDLMVEAECEDVNACWSKAYGAANDENGGARVDIVIRKPGELERRQDDVGYMDWDIAREGVVLYPPGALPLTVTSIPRPRCVSEGPAPSVRDWLARAAEDLRAIETNLVAPPVPWSSVAFHSQQAAEKYLKVLLVCADVRPPHTHELAELVKAARAAGYELPALEADCELLSTYAVAARYPEHVPIPSDAEGLAALEAGRRVVSAVRVHFERLRVA